MDFELSLRETVEQYGLMAKKALGQNFLLDQNITDKIIRLSLQKQGLKSFSGCHVYEIGPGPGGLTRAVLNACPEKLTVVEMDERCIRILEDLRTAVGANMSIVKGDALQFDFSVTDGLAKQIVSNLPYNISVPLLIGWLEKIELFSGLTLMFQKEVAERILAPIKNKNYGRISVLAQLMCRIEKLFDLNPECFVPAPKIWSSVLLFQPLDKYPTKEMIRKVSVLTQLAFGQRRKMIRQSLKTVMNIEKACESAGVSMTCRAEEVTPQQYLIMAQNL